MATRYSIQGLSCIIILTILLKINLTTSLNQNKRTISNNLIVISFDGFRYNYINSTSTPNIFQLRSKATWSEAMLNVFPTKTFTNHFSMVTGMYPGSHGVLDSSVRVNGKLITYSAELFKSNKSSVPLWTQAEKGGVKSMVMYWSGSDFEYEGILPTELIPFKSNNLTWSESIDLALKFLYSDTSSRLVMIYLNEPDKEAHAFGSESPEVREWIKNIDNLIGYLNKKVNSINTNIVIVSDHGMDTVTFERVIDLNKYLDNSTYDTAGTSPCLQIFPKNGKYNEVLKTLQEAAENNKFRILEKSKIPNEWFYAYSPRAPPLLALTDAGYGLQDFYNVDYYKNYYHLPDDHIWSLGSHGYHPLENNKMLATFFAWGPDVRQNNKLPDISGLPKGVGARTIDLYGLWCNMLDLSCPTRDGSMDELFKKVILRKNAKAFHSISGQNNIVSSNALLILCLITLISKSFSIFN